MIFMRVFFLPQASFRVFRASYYWAAKSSNHSKPICVANQRVPWASPKRLKSHSIRNYWALTSTSKKGLFSPAPLYDLLLANGADTAYKVLPKLEEPFKTVGGTAEQILQECAHKIEWMQSAEQTRNRSEPSSFSYYCDDFTMNCDHTSP